MCDNRLSKFFGVDIPITKTSMSQYIASSEYSIRTSTSASALGCFKLDICMLDSKYYILI